MCCFFAGPRRRSVGFYRARGACGSEGVDIGIERSATRAVVVFSPVTQHTYLACYRYVLSDVDNLFRTNEELDE